MAKSDKIAGIRGMDDLLPPTSQLFTYIEQTAARVFSRYSYQEVRTPIVEPAGLFERGVGEGSAVVKKQMYKFADPNKAMLALRPEATASVVRAYINANISNKETISRYFYAGPMFRYERPQKGRKRQFFQLGVELLGASQAAADAEVIAMTAHFFAELNVSGLDLQLNSIGCKTCRPAFNKKLQEFLQASASELCEDCQERMERNPLRTFDCKNSSCQHSLQNAPRISQHWCEDCAKHFDEVQAALTTLNVKYTLNDKIVRGLDYYMRTAFEFLSSDLGAQSAVAAGGRYDGLIADLGGEDIPGVGVAMGVERILLLLEAQNQLPNLQEELILVAPLSQQAVKHIFPTIQQLRAKNLRVEWEYEPRSLKSQMRKADKVGASKVVMIGDDELNKEEVTVRDMKTKQQKEIKLAELVSELTK